MQLKAKLLNVVYKHKWLGSLWVSRLYRKSSEFRNWVEDYKESNFILKFSKLGELNPGKPIYNMYFDDSAWGFFAYWKYALIGLSLSDLFGMTPVITWGSKCPYYESQGFMGTDNAFEYYYKPVSSISIEEANQSQIVLQYSRFSLGVDSIKYDADSSIGYVPMCKKYIKLQDPIEKRLREEIQSILGEKKTIAVHIRGVEWGNIAGHPIPIGLDEYISKIKNALESGFEQVFIATDSEKTLNHLQTVFPKCLVFYEDVERTKEGSKTLVIFDETKHEKMRNFSLGYQVLRDMYTMSYCQGLIAGYSNVSLAAKVTKEARDEEYEYLHIFDQRLKEGGLSSVKAEKLMRSGKYK